MNDWRPIDSAPRDGTEVYLHLNFPNGVPAYWDRELKTWVLCRPLHIESLREPKAWRPKP